LGFALLLGIGLAAPLLAADPPDDAEPSTGLNFHWASWMQDTGRPVPKKKAPATKSKDTAAAKPAAAKVANVVDRVTTEREREVKAYLRRVTVCDELRRVALETHDEVLERKVDFLEQRAKAVYEQRTAHLPGHNVDVAADEQTLDRHLGSADSGGLQPAIRSNRGSQVAVGEGKP